MNKMNWTGSKTLPWGHSSLYWKRSEDSIESFMLTVKVEVCNPVDGGLVFCRQKTWQAEQGIAALYSQAVSSCPKSFLA